MIDAKAIAEDLRETDAITPHLNHANHVPIIVDHALKTVSIKNELVDAIKGYYTIR